MQIIITVKNVYGNELVYPVCPKAKLFAELAGSKTLTHSALVKIEALGYTIVQSRLPSFAI
jgi:hypothetical protein